MTVRELIIQCLEEADLGTDVVIAVNGTKFYLNDIATSSYKNQDMCLILDANKETLDKCFED